MIPRFTPSMEWCDIWAASSNSLHQDHAVASFEAVFAEHANQEYAVAFPYGRTGLNFLLRALGLDNREIICPAYTCVVVPNAVVYSGNRPVFIDSSRDDANMDIRAAEQAITDNTGAIIATSIFGHPVNLDLLDELRSRHPSLPIIQDCAHSFFADWDGRPVHKEGCATLFALNISKLSCSVFGGMVTTDDHALALRLRELRDAELAPATTWKTVSRFLYSVAAVTAFNSTLYGLTLKLQRAHLLDRFTKYYEANLIDMPDDWLDALSNFEARVGISSLTRLGDRISARRQYATYYREKLKNHPAIRFFPLPPQADASYSHCAVLVSNPQEVRETCRRQGVELGELIEYVVPLMDAYRDTAETAGDFLVSKAISNRVINLPVASKFVQSHADRAIKVLLKVLESQPPAPDLLECA
ncbi:MAG: hypothetical protein COA62_11730 [Rhodobiaceae bacterium]|nr:MAG: hypothetical protein COA62_11730 [Rhodobiaceae bacterium]